MKIFLGHNNKSFVYIFTLFVMIFLSGFALSLSSLLRREDAITQNFIHSKETFYHAEAGVALAMARLRVYGSNSFNIGCLMDECDITGDGMTDFMIAYYPSAQITTITGYPTTVGSNQVSNIELRTADGGINSALQIGRDIICSQSSGTINGDVRYGSVNNLCDDGGSFVFTVNGNTTQELGSFVPQPSLDDPSVADYQDTSGTTAYVDETFSPGYTGGTIYYSYENITITGGSVNFTGTFIVEGNLTFTDIPSGITLTPEYKNFPALIVGGTLTFNNVSGLYIDGLVYANDISFSDVTGSPVINGMLLSQNDITLNNVTDLTVTFDAEHSKAPFFSAIGNSGNDISLLQWREYFL